MTRPLKDLAFITIVGVGYLFYCVAQLFLWAGADRIAEAICRTVDKVVDWLLGY